MDSDRARGRCLCGEVRYEAAGPTGAMWYCHCRECRKANGVGFATWVEAPGAHWLSGADRVRRFAASAALTRASCSQCGTVLPAQRSAAGALLPAGGLENVGQRRPRGHTFGHERLPWLPHLDEHLRALGDSCGHAAAPPIRSTAPVAAAVQPTDVTARGSCLCGAIAYEVDRPLSAMRVCHCSRCRRRSGSSWFVGLACRPGALRLLRGEAEIASWHMPASRFYTTSFCRVCGGAAPAVLPHATFLSAGCFDDDPGARALCHIFYGSRASWVEVRDGLPRFEEFTPPGFDWQANRP